MKGRRKYGNKKVEFMNMTFDSKKEMQRYVFLLGEQEKGKIHGLKRQVTFELLPKMTKDEVVHLKTKDKIVQKVMQLPVTYTCDFLYWKGQGYDSRLVVEDVKISKYLLPPEYVLRKKMMLALKGIAIKEVYNATDDT